MIGASSSARIVTESFEQPSAAAHGTRLSSVAKNDFAVGVESLVASSILTVMTKKTTRTIGICTGGDCPALNAVIRAAVRTAKLGITFGDQP